MSRWWRRSEGPLGEEHAFLERIRVYDKALRALAFRLLESPEAMDDALQETYLRAYRDRHRFRGESEFGTWLYRIAYNVCIDKLRFASRETTLNDEAPSSDAVLESTEVRVDVQGALAALPAEQRALLLMIDADGFTYDEAASVLGIKTGTVASRLSRARQAFRNALPQYLAREMGE